MNTIPFDLEKYKAGAIAVNRNGDKYRFVAICPEARSNEQLISINIESLMITTRKLNGMFLGDQVPNDADFIGLLPQKKTAWAQPALFYSDEEYERVSVEDQHHFVKVEYYE